MTKSQDGKTNPQDEKKDQNKIYSDKNMPTNKGHEDSLKHHKKGKFPQRVWPTDSEKNKGPKV